MLLVIAVVTANIMARRSVLSSLNVLKFLNINNGEYYE